MLLFETWLWLLTIHSSVDSKIFTTPSCLFEVTGFMCTAERSTGSGQIFKSKLLVVGE